MRQTIKNPIARGLAAVLMAAAPVLWMIGFPLVVFAIHKAMNG
ncbi:hypothetical protein [Aurantimonas sp. Leaf443]|nr:hypothetical protein [Aurantimonas sp. Leaf443]